MPYAPTERYDFTPLVIGASQFGRGIGDAIAGTRERQQREEQFAALGKAADFTRKGIPDLQAQIDDTTWGNMSAREKAAVADRFLAMSRMQMEEEYRTAQIGALEAEALSKMNEGRAEASALQGLGQFFRTPQVPMKNPPALDLQSLAAYAQQNPQVANTKAFAQLVEVAKASKPSPDPLRRQTPWGEEYMVDANQIVRQPRAETKEAGVTITRDPLTGELRETYTGNLGQVEALRKAATGITGEQQMDSAPAAPRDAKARKAGTVYQTPRGPLKWTGTGWVQP